jgi:hypothetical protein
MRKYDVCNNSMKAEIVLREAVTWATMGQVGYSAVCTVNVRRERGGNF